MSIDYLMTLVVYSSVNIILASSLNVLVGFAGQVSLGHAAFFGIGAYTSAIFTVKFGWSYWWALPMAVLLGGIIGFLLGLPALRVKEDFLVLATIGINFVVVAIFNYIPFFGGPYGIVGLPRPGFGNYRFNTFTYAFYSFIVCVAVLIFIRYISKVYVKMGFDALRENESAAESIGVSTARYKIYAFSIAGALAGLAGNLWAHYMGVIFPDNFSFGVSIGIITMVVIGGIGTIIGPVIGAIIITLLPEMLRVIENFRMLVYGIIIILTMMYLPDGLVSLFKKRSV
ncbi:branched-chain amino acid ABC transporter permease [Thermosipho ferrireducens]|uniref:Branched-chain amino acid ABC transporter permease n=1 Tax=Thermosipho ferrireducens TaxID=2571116 RepID=A0ABX7S911_9BACT|nr:branched-chain amino acid ABC transporter permease [Thermosipho ferrireducens]QTA38335.1 branched-chain amino acid ABC transporter permease [Thermosipho ferrireducens]